ncbi:MAG: TRAP transporter large permease [Planctomycetota bacterium]|jgi:tripartite ATP-independent transporter DctM subunit|nr:TRAP transporter large permease [Planctomycetota bacterium]
MTMILVFLATLLLGVPISFSLGLTAVAGLYEMDPEFLIAIPQKLFATSNAYSMIAIPLFIMTGEIMGISGDIGRMMEFSRALIGRVKGGLAYVCLIVGTMIGGLLGMANAAAALLSTTLYPEMVKDKYAREFAAPFIAAVSVISPMIPPGLLFVIYGVASNTSIAAIFAAGFPTGIMIAMMLGLIVYAKGRNSDWPVSQTTTTHKEFLAISKRAAFSIFAPLMIFSFIAIGVCTPTEAAAVACVATFCVGTFVYKKIKFGDMKRILTSTAEISGAILIISAMGGVLGWNLTLAMIPQAIAVGIASISDNPLVILLIVQFFLFLVGMIMDSAPAVMILVPVFMPIMKRFDLDPVHFGLLMCLNLSIGLLTPPVGTVLYTTSAATGVPANRMIRAIWPWVGALMLVLSIITFLPQTVMWLPRLITQR